jgi:hypothetical protein
MLFSAYGFESAGSNRSSRPGRVTLSERQPGTSYRATFVESLRDRQSPSQSFHRSRANPASKSDTSRRTIETFRLLISRMRLQEYKHFAPGYFHLVPTGRLLLHSSYRLSWIECDASDRSFAICYLLFPSAISFLVTVPSIQPWGASVGRKSVF